MEQENWKICIVDKIVLSGTDKLESIVEGSVLEYLRTYNQDSITDPFKLAIAIVDLYGPSVMEKNEVRSLLFEHIEEKKLFEIASNFNISEISLPNIVKAMVRKGWKWGGDFSNKIIDILEIDDIKIAYKSSLDDLDDIVLEDYSRKLIEINNFYELHSFQVQIKEDVIKNINLGDKKNLVRLPTGGGKTRVAVHTLAKIIYDNKDKEARRYLWLTYEPLLASQACETFLDVYKVIGSVDLKISKLFYHYKQHLPLSGMSEVLFANITSLSNKLSNENDILKYANDVDTIIFDEVHQVKAPIAFSLITKLLSLNHNINFIGLTATPGRGDLSGDDSLGFLKFFDAIVETKIPPSSQVFGDLTTIELNEKKRTAVSYLQELGVLARLEELRLNYQELSQISPTTDTRRNKLIIDCIKERIDKDEKIIVFAASAEHARLISILLKAENIDVGLVLGENRQFRENIIKRFRKDNLNLLITYEVLTTGFDAPEIDTLIIARPTKSIVTYSQILGRALRGKLNGGHEKNTIINISDPSFGDVNEVYKEFSEYWSEK